MGVGGGGFAPQRPPPPPLPPPPPAGVLPLHPVLTRLRKAIPECQTKKVTFCKRNQVAEDSDYAPNFYKREPLHEGLAAMT
jgi:hypothetical protein